MQTGHFTLVAQESPMSPESPEQGGVQTEELLKERQLMTRQDMRCLYVLSIDARNVVLNTQKPKMDICKCITLDLSLKVDLMTCTIFKRCVYLVIKNKGINTKARGTRGKIDRKIKNYQSSRIFVPEFFNFDQIKVRTKL